MSRRAQNCNFDSQDVERYFQIFEKDLGSLKGKDKDNGTENQLFLKI
jgi:hypothetical protein